MVKDLFVDFNTFVNQMTMIEGYALIPFINEWEQGIHKTHSNLENKYFLPYPYHIGYIGKYIEENLNTDIAKERYEAWHKVHLKSIEIIKDNRFYGKVAIPLLYNMDNTPTWETFFNYRILPFINSSITKEEYEKYADCAVMISLDRNKHAILTEGDKTGHIEKSITVKDRISVSMLVAPIPKVWFVYNDDRPSIDLGEVEYGMLDERIIEAEKAITGNIYLFDDKNLG